MKLAEYVKQSKQKR